MITSLLRSLDIATMQVVAALFIQTCYVLGTVNSIGVFYSEFQDSLGMTSTDIGISLGLFNAFTFGPGPIVAHLYGWSGLRRPLLITGAILAPLGLVLSSLVTNSVQLAICLSVGGLGANILSQSLVICLDAHAHDHFNSLFGISKSGYAFGMLISPVLAAFLMDMYGWRGAMLIMGAITCHLIPLTVMVDTSIEDKSEKLATSESLVCPDPSDERYIEDREMGNCPAIKYASPSRAINSHINTTTNNFKNKFNSGHCDSLESGAVQYNCNEMQDTSMPEYTDSIDGHYSTSIALSERTRSEIGSESSSLMEINQGTQLQSRCRHHQGMKELSRPGRDAPPAADTSSKLSFKKIRQTFTDSVYNQDKCLSVLLIANSFVAMLHGGWHAFFVPHAISRGMSLHSTLYLLYSTSIACFIARVFSGVLVNPRFMTGYDLFLLLRVVNVASILADIYSSNFAVMIVTSFVTSFAINEENVFMIVVVKERSPRRAFPLVFAVTQIAFGIGALFGTYLTGMLADIHGSYKASFIFLVSIEAAILFITIPPRFIKSKFQEDIKNIKDIKQ